MQSIKKALMLSGVLFWLALLILIFGKAMAQGYKITGTKAAGWAITALGGFADGALEGYQFDGRKSFERKWDADPNGFWGSESWRLAYKNGNPDEGYRNLFTEVYGAPDFYHVADDVSKMGYVGGSITLGIGAKKANSKWWHYAIDFAASMAISAGAKRLGMEWVRN